MRELERRRKFKSIVQSPVMLVVFLVVVAFMGKSVWNVYQKEQVSASRLERTQNEMAGLEARNATLTKSVDYLKTNEGIDAEIRNKFRGVRDGEEVAVIVESHAASTTIATVHSWWSRFLHFFGKAY